ncbi:MAG: DNA mismatch repair protein MutS [Eubacterium sp.]|nr:DNA mismatch repair protein MutS [Eubacterium sp.]
MMQHYLQTKEAYPDCILFYRLGDFYEMFFEDAQVTARELELTLTGKQCGLPERAPMCGVPYHAVDTYLARLVEKGYKVAICEQVEDPKLAKGMVKREVVRVVTPGTMLNAEGLDEARHNYIMSIVSMTDVFGLAIADVSTGSCLVTEIGERDALSDEILKFMPSEILCNQSFFVSGIDIEDLKNRLHITFSTPEEWYFDQDACEKILKKHFHVGTLKGLGITDFPCGVTAAGALFTYLYETQKSDMRQITEITPYYADRFMLLDSATRRNLELTETLREKQKRGSLLWVLDKTKTAMGARLLRTWVEQPLVDKNEIVRRHAAVETLCSAPMDRDELREYLQPVYDLERLISRIVYQSANPRDLVAFRTSLEMLPHIRAVTENLDDPLLQELLADLDPLEDLCSLVQDAIVDEPPLAMKEGGIIRDGYHEMVDQYRRAGRDGKQWMAELEEAERERTGIRTLRIRFNKVFGYCIEITNSFKDKVPDDYVRRQTLTNAERYTMPKLKEMEETILGAEERLSGLEYELFSDIRNKIATEVVRIQKTAAAAAALDVLASFSFVAERNQYVRPRMRTDGVLTIRDGRHPVVEQMLKDDLFIPNDTMLDKDEQRVAIITGPNMAGKSTYMRQCALIVLMAQIGSFVPAASAEIGVADRIFTRVGASDDLASGKSTFMVEMNEVANILRNATADSLLILDEIGRGTSTFDGLSIAWAVVEYIADQKKIGARTLFATHYHELTELEGAIPGVQNYCIAVKERGDDIIFLRKIVRGGADRSYGIQVARLAGVPAAVLERAEIISEQLQESDIIRPEKAIRPADTSGVQLSLFDTVREPGIPGTSSHPSDHHRKTKKERAQEKVLEQLKTTDLMRMTPLDALNLLYQMQNEIL